MNEYPITSQRGAAMLTYLPDYYQSSRVMRVIVQEDGRELDLAREALQAILRQFYPQIADLWGIELWESELTLPPGEVETIDERRQRIIAKLRGYGTAIIKVIKNMAEAYDKGHITIAEDFARYSIIRFVDTAGIPSNLDDLKAILREIIPAHLEIVYEYNYFIWDELDQQNWTWDQLDALNLSWDQLEVYK